MSPDHPNAQFLRDVYETMARVKSDQSLDPATREQRIAAIVADVRTKTSPDCVTHTGGIELAAIGDMAFAAIMQRRRAALSANTFTPSGRFTILADDDYGIVRGQYTAERNGVREEWEGMGVWRFDQGVAVEHWEIGPSRSWDAYFLAGDPTFTGGTAEEFWRRDALS